MAPIVAAVSALAATQVGSLILSTVARVALSYALSKILAPDLDAEAQQTDPGLRTKTTLTGGVNPSSLIMGYYCTAGVWVCAPYWHGVSGGTPNAYITYIIELADLPIGSLDSLIIDGQYVPIGPGSHASYGTKLGGKFENKAWVKFYNGLQTAADPMLLAKYGTFPRRPWKSDMIGLGVPYMILTFKRDANVMPDWPQVRAVVTGRWYDPRKDSSVGGSGPQRWADQSTWGWTTNNIVLAYNVARGINFPDGSHWGGRYSAEELPLDNWFAGMNACDQPVAKADGGTEPRYQAGREIFVTDEPAAVFEELLRGCDARIADIGGTLKVRVGGPALPVYFFTDKDIVISRSQSYDPYPSMDEVYNAVHATYPSPGNLWEDTEAPPRLSPAYEAADGGERRPLRTAFPATPFKLQVQRLQTALLKRGRLMRTISAVLLPEAAKLEPLDTVSWTSERNFWTGKGFELEQVVDEPVHMLQAINGRETNPSVYDWSSAQEMDDEDTPDEAVVPPAASVPGFAATAGALVDAAAQPRRPTIQITWTAADLDDVKAVEYEIRLTGSTEVFRRGAVMDVAAGGTTVSEGILAQQSYEVRTRLVIPGLTSDWTTWSSVTSGTARLVTDDLVDGAVSTSVSDFVTGVAIAESYTLINTISVPNDVFDYSSAKMVCLTLRLRWVPPEGAASNLVIVRLKRTYVSGGITFIVFSEARHTFHVGSVAPSVMWAVVTVQEVYGASSPNTTSEIFEVHAQRSASGTMSAYTSLLTGVLVRK